MKKKSFIVSLAGAALFLCTMPSCMDLDENVYDKVQADKFGKNEAEIASIVGPAYRSLNQYVPYNFMALSECAGDMAMVPTRLGGDWYDGGQYRELHMHSWTANTNVIKSCWSMATKSISTCNLVYDIVKNNKYIDEELRARTLAEIRGVRAIWLYIMMDNWGNIPLTTDFNDTSLPSVTPRKEVYNFILSELNEIKDQVRSEVTSTTYGTFTKGTAYALMAKMYLNAEAWGVDVPRWQEAADACDEVMKLGYIIEPSWSTNFAVNNYASKEIIFPICFSANDQNVNKTDYRNRLFAWTLHYKDNLTLGLKVTGDNGVCAQPNYVKLFDNDDPRKNGSFLLGEMIDPSTGKVIMTAHDRPLIHTEDVTIIPGTERDGTAWGDVNQEDGGRAIKWPFDKSTVDGIENDFALFRLADIYLMKAECLVRMGKDNAEATRLVNEVRERGFGNSDHNYSSVTLDEIALERKLELAWECYSRQDCIRFGTFQNARFLKPSTKGEDYKNLFPIPQDAWQTNQNLKQNPGYPAFG